MSKIFTDLRKFEGNTLPEIQRLYISGKKYFLVKTLPLGIQLPVVVVDITGKGFNGIIQEEIKYSLKGYTDILSNVSTDLPQNTIVEPPRKPSAVRRLLFAGYSIISNINDTRKYTTCLDIHRSVRTAYLYALQREPDIPGYLHSFQQLLELGNFNEFQEGLFNSNEAKSKNTPVLKELSPKQYPDLEMGDRKILSLSYLSDEPENFQELDRILRILQKNSVDLESLLKQQSEKLFPLLFGTDQNGCLIFRGFSEIQKCSEVSSDNVRESVYILCSDYLRYYNQMNHLKKELLRTELSMEYFEEYWSLPVSSVAASFILGKIPAKDFLTGLEVYDRKLEQFVNQVYFKILGRIPDQAGFQSAVQDIYLSKITRADLVISMLNSDEFRIKTFKRFSFERLAQKYSELCPPPSCQQCLTVKYLGPIGVSGYARAAKCIIKSLLNAGIQVYFEIYDVYEFQEKNIDDDDKLLLSLTRPLKFDLLVIHSTPPGWKNVIAREKEKYDFPFKTYGITVWESDRVPDEWVEEIQAVDQLSLPNVWNRKVFAEVVPNCITVHHPIMKIEESANVSFPWPGEERIPDDYYLFYTINEWNGRKGINSLIDVFLRTFNGNDKVALFIKTSGNVSEKAGRKYLEDARRSLSNPPRVCLSYEHLSTEQIGAIHSRGNCFVSLTCAEGTGYGLCEAALWNKPILTNFYGAQNEYIKGCFYVRYDLKPAKFCSEFDPIHSDCTSRCKFNLPYDSSKQKWGVTDLDETSKMLKFLYERNIRIGNPFTREYILSEFNLNKIGQEFRKSFENML